MDYPTPIVERIHQSFLTQNPYAQSALNIPTLSNSADEKYVLALMAVAYELSQIKYHLSRGNKHGKRTAD